ncbi:MAG: porin [Kofleriaceae bacterium]
MSFRKRSPWITLATIGALGGAAWAQAEPAAGPEPKEGDAAHAATLVLAPEQLASLTEELRDLRGQLEELERRDPLDELRDLRGQLDELERRGPRLGYARTGLFWTTRDGLIRLRPTLRLQTQAYAFYPRLDRPNTPRDSFFLRRARAEFFGALFGARVQFNVSVEAAFLINGRAPAGDEYVRFDLSDAFKLQLGQFNVPFTLDNRSMEPYLDFLERSFVVRNLGTANKDPGVMAFGKLLGGRLFYEGGLFNGGEINTRNADNQFDVVGRAYARPLAGSTSPWRALQVGGSASWGAREGTNDPYLGGMIPSDRSWLSTAFGVGLFPVSYNAADVNRTAIGVVPEGHMWRAAAELVVPWDRFILRAEYLHLDSDIDEKLRVGEAVVREGGRLSADGAYVELGYWLLGDPTAFPELGSTPDSVVSVKETDVPRDWHLATFVRSNYVDANYRAGRTVFVGALGPSQVDGRYRLFDVQGIVNLWWTRHLRFSLGHTYTRLLEGDHAQLPTAGQRNIHETSARVQLYL